MYHSPSPPQLKRLRLLSKQPTYPLALALASALLVCHLARTDAYTSAAIVVARYVQHPYSCPEVHANNARVAFRCPAWSYTYRRTPRSHAYYSVPNARAFVDRTDAHEVMTTRSCSKYLRYSPDRCQPNPQGGIVAILRDVLRDMFQPIHTKASRGSRTDLIRCPTNSKNLGRF